MLRTLPLLLTAVYLLTFFACRSEDDPTDPGPGSLEVGLTDAAVDNPEVAGVFITVKEVRADELPLEGFGVQTVELTAYQNGAVRSLGGLDIEAGRYDNLTLVLDFNQDDQGNTPGCYLLTTDGEKDDLRTGADIDRAVRVFGLPYDIRTGATTELVVDFDLRKSLIRYDNEAIQPYALVTTPELEGALRYVERAHTGSVQGDCIDCLAFADKVVVYAYENGEFQRETEPQPQGVSGVRFANSVTSGAVDADGSFSLHFLPAGDYDLYFAGYNVDEEDPGLLELAGAIELNVVTSPDLIDLSVSAQGATGVTVEASGLVPF